MLNNNLFHKIPNMIIINVENILYLFIGFYFHFKEMTEVHFSICMKCGFMGLYKACEGYLKPKGYICSCSEG